MGHFLTMGSVGALGLLHSLSDDGVALDKLGLIIVRGLGGNDSLLNNSNILSVDLVRLKYDGIVTLDNFLGLGVFG